MQETRRRSSFGRPLYVVGAQPSEPITVDDLARLDRQLEELRAIVNDPIALIARAMALLTGTAERLI